jgi:hypothetical protein
MSANDTTIVALSPTDMATAQADLVAWCVRKVADVRAELSDLETNLEIATERGWKYQTVAASITRTQRRVIYYEKIKAAVEAGYLIVPNFPIDVFAVRVKRARQPEHVTDSRWSGQFTADAQLLPAGEGRYVDDRVEYRDESHVAMVNGKEQHVRRYVTTDYADVDFPVTLVKPAVLGATARAMALRVFDEMGTVTNRSGRDPIVVGRLRDPRGNGRCCTFFIAWWLDAATL